MPDTQQKIEDYGGCPITRFYFRWKDNQPLWVGAGFLLGAGTVLVAIAIDQLR